MELLFFTPSPNLLAFHTALVIMLKYATVVLLIVLLCISEALEQPIIHNDTGRVCPVGFFENGNACQPCPKGTFRGNTNPFVCLPCPPGTAGRRFGVLDNCEPCAKEKFQPREGSEQCLVCPSDTTTNGKTGAVKCQPCPSGSFAGPRLFFGDRCVRCRAGEFFNTAATLPGVPGVPIAEGFGRCETCAEGTFTPPGGARKCESCPPKQFLQSFAGPCISCQPGTFLSSSAPGRCQQCSNGSYQPLPGASSCIPCPTGSVTAGKGAAFCSVSSNMTQIPSCPIGTGFGACGLISAQCAKCVADFASPPSSTTPCFKCYNQTRPTTDGSSCICPPNHKFLGIAAISPCMPCPSGATSSGMPGSECVCPKGQYIDQARGQCVCPPRQRFNGSDCVACASNARPGDPGCDFCPVGTGLGQTSNKCESCGPFAPRIPTFGACVAFSCPPDQFVKRFVQCECREADFILKDNGRCEKCPVGTGTGFGRRNICEPCSQSSRIFNGTNCVFCSAQEQIFNNTCVAPCATQRRRDMVTSKCKCESGVEISPSLCGTCPQNRLFAPSLGKCMCTDNFFEIQDGSCERCPGGTVSNTDGVCRACGSLKFRPREQDFACLVCEKADPDVIKAAKCLAAKCVANEFVGRDGRCRSCPLNTRLLNRTCVPCGKGQVSPGGRRAFCSLRNVNA